MQNHKEAKGLWKNYWHERQRSLRISKGKIRAVTAAFQIAERLAKKSVQPIRVIELGCGEGHILGELLKMCEANGIPIGEWIGVDNQAGIIARARRLYPQIDFLVADYASQPLGLKPFDLVLLVGTLHEVYSASRSVALREIDPVLGRKAVEQAISYCARLVADSRYIVVFDGIEHSLSNDFEVTLNFQSANALNEFRKFAGEYEAFRVRYKEVGGDRIRISMRDFTRYITKTRFLNGDLWEIEKWESYQYFSESAFRACLRSLGIKVLKLQCSSPHLKDWRSRVRIETADVDFPKENILIVGRRDKGDE